LKRQQPTRFAVGHGVELTVPPPPRAQAEKLSPLPMTKQLPADVVQYWKLPLEPLLLPLLLLDVPPLLLLDVLPLHSLAQLVCTHCCIAEDAEVQLCSSAFDAHDSIRLALYVPFGHTHPRRSLHPLSTPFSCDEHFELSQLEHAELVEPLVLVRLATHELPDPPPPPPPPLLLLLLEHATTSAIASPLIVHPKAIRLFMFTLPSRRA
jgi:hypothetical protein